MIKYIEQLLQGQPVVWKPLGEVFNTRNGYTPSKQKREYWEGGTIPWYRMEDLRESGRILKSAIQCVTEEGVKRSGLFKKGSIILATTATIGEHALLDCDALANQQFTNFEVKETYQEVLLPKFVFYYFDVVDEWCKQTLTNVSSFPSVDVARLLRQPFPIPPLSVQAEIVRILDSFTSLTAELEAELEARRAQYAHYRDELLDFTRGGRGEVVYRPLGEVASYSDERVDASLIDTHSYVGVDNLLQDRGGKGPSSYLPEKGRLTSYSPDDILIGNIRPYLKKIWLADNEGGASGDVLVIRVREAALIPRYLYYVLASDLFFAYAMQYSKGAKMPRGSKTRIMLYPIPIPPLEEQERIVRVLDEFDTLTSSLTEGLPREIELRRQQYAYYRDQLLSFPRDEA